MTRAPADLSISLAPPGDLDGLERIWRALEEISDGSFFQSWAWVGCLARERYDDPLLLQAHCSGRLVALAMFNRGHGGWFGPPVLRLGETGHPLRDAVFVEYNGPLLARGAQHLLPACLKATFDVRKCRLVLSGVDDACLRALRETGGFLHVRKTSPAAMVDFSRLEGREFLAGLSANTRYQIRRSARLYAKLGKLAVQRANSITESEEFLDHLAAFHQATWRSRGKPGAFANPDFTRFHRTLIARAFPAGEVDLLRITAGEKVIGYLYNFCFRGRVSAYQSGFDYAAITPHHKPGLTCHHLAIEMYRAAGAGCYDFLAGDSRYKTSLANASVVLHWAEMLPGGSLSAKVLQVRQKLFGA